MAGSDWQITGEQDLGGAGRGSLRRVAVRLPDGVEFEQYVLLLPSAVVVLAVNERGEVLMLHRHRFIVDRWVWELPGGYVEEGEDLAAAAERELLEETGWRAESVTHLVTFQPMLGSADAENHVFVAEGVSETDEGRDINEAGEVRWISLEEADRLVQAGDILGAASVVAIAQLRAERHQNG